MASFLDETQMFVLMRDLSAFAQSYACMHIFQTTLPIHEGHESRTTIGDLQGKDRLRRENKQGGA